MCNTSIVKIENLDVSYNKNDILKNICIDIGVNERWAIIGKNGTGKSTLIKCICSLIQPRTGSVIIDGKDIRSYKGRVRARKIAYVPQKTEGIIPYCVYDYVMLGRYSSFGFLSIPGEMDHQKVVEALKICDVKHLQNRLINTLSGGELQRVLLAGALAQQTPVLLLDEPTTFLDPAHERMFFHALERARENNDLTIIMVTHDINAALLNCTHVCGLLDGTILFKGDVQSFKDKCPDLLLSLFGIEFLEYVSEKVNHSIYGTWSVPW